MDAVKLTDARARLSELVDRVEAGDTVMPPQDERAADLVRSMRDGDRC